MTSSHPLASRAFRLMAVSCARSLPTLVTSCATIRWCSASTAILHIVADNASALTAGRHRAGIGIDQGDLFVGRGLNLLANLAEGVHLPPQALNLLLKADCLCLGHIAVLPVGTVQGRQVARDAGLHLLNALGDLGHC